MQVEYKGWHFKTDWVIHTVTTMSYPAVMKDILQGELNPALVQTQKQEE